MAIRSKENVLSAWAFLIGIVLAILGGVLSALFGNLHPLFLGLLLLLGLLIGFIGVAPNDVDKFLMSAVSLVIVSFAGSAGVRNIEFLNWEIGNVVSSTLGALLVLLVPATIVVAVRSLFSISQR
jgi:MFS family permease